MSAERATDEELLAAYCDGVTELSLDERKRVEALLAARPGLRTDEAATRELISTMRELPAEGTEPDWTAMERAIRAEVGPDVPRQWWRPMWRWLVPLTAVATMATIALLAFDGDRDDEREPIAAVIDAGVPMPVPAPVIEPADSVAIRLDGEAFVLEAADDDVLEVDEMLLGTGSAGFEGLLSSGDLAWIDELDDEDAAFADKWLDERKKG